MKRPRSSGAACSAPELLYQPRDPRSYRPPIGLIGCGGITNHHLKAYRKALYDVVALCDVDVSRARQRSKQYYPAADVYEDYRTLLRRDDIEVVDITTHPHERVAIVEAALLAGKHVLSQKPFVLDLDEGERLAELAERRGVRLAVNQNGRWAPHFSYIARAIEKGLLGQVASVCCSVHWDHEGIAGTAFEEVRHLILYDFAIHWFDILTCFLSGKTARSVFASCTHAPGQKVKPAMLGQAMVQYDDAQAVLTFDGATRFGPEDRTYVRGTQGTAVSTGVDCKDQTVTLHTDQGSATPELVGCWFPDGFRGTMGELLCAIEENRRPTIDAAGNLRSLALCFAAVASAERGEPVVPGSVRKMP